MEAVECGAAALGIVLGYYGRHVPLEELRVACGVSRDGSKASNMVRAARAYGLVVKGYRKEPAGLRELRLPLIVHWSFNHFVVVEGFGSGKVYLNDPATGPRTVSAEEFDRLFTGVVLACEPSPTFERGGARRGLLVALVRRLAGVTPAITYLIVAGLVLAATGLAIPAFVRVFVDSILIDGQDWVLPVLAGMLMAAMLRAGATWLQQYYLLRLQTGLAIGTSSAFLWHVLHLPIEFFAHRFAGDIGSRVAINDRVARLIAGDLANAALNLLLIVFYALLMLQYDPVLTTIGVIIAGFNFLTLRYVSRRLTDENQRVVTERGKLVGTTISGLQTIETMKASGAESDFFARWAGHQARLLNAQQRVGAVAQLLAVVPPFLMALNTAAILAIGGLRVTEGVLSIGMLVAFQSLMVSFLAPVNQMVALGTTIQSAEGDMHRLDDIINHRLAPNVEGSGAALDGAATGARLEGYLELRGVTFGYSPLAPPLIAQLDLALKPGDRVALVGGSGSGKSTVARLVAGLYQPWHGEVLFDGHPRTVIPRSVMSASLAMVDQNIFLFEGTIRENLTLWDSTMPESDIVNATRDAAIHDEIAARSDGYNHPIEEDGRNFSGGQRQRLEIARALVGNPSILILDEATSALDTITEQQIDEQLRRRGCTCLIVAHRLSTIRDCDEIVVLERGQVVQRGRHDEMIKVDGPYARLIKSEEHPQDRRTSLLERL